MKKQTVGININQSTYKI
ncbi:hypothetical protein OIU77_002316 [Salix suchowensis]|uniref:Uncharacterized protein n=1 Tax=Salix suchowensis TaxID=1278906 RepID=A0ABQ9B530_9ROSI|nr:hypothetical protein OIU77_002316 [Salix suchowensis]